MKANVKLYKSDGEFDLGFPVKLIISHNRKTRRKTISHSREVDWDPAHQLPKLSHFDYEDLYAEIMEIKTKAGKLEFKKITEFEKAFDFLQEPSQQKRITDFYEWADRQILVMEKQKRDGNAAAYREIRDELKKISPSLPFQEITPKFIERFKNHKKEAGLKNTSIRKLIGEFRAIYNSAIKAEIIEEKKPFSGAMNDLPIQKRRARNRYLSEEKIWELERLELEYRSYQRAIDFSLLQFYLCGADLVDIYYLKKNNITKSRIFLTRKKLGAKGYEFDVLLSQKAKKIIEKYDDRDKENEFVFPWGKSWTSYKTFRDNHNRDLKILQKRLKIELEPKNDNFTSKVMRHTFATLGKFARIEEDLLRELMGHERNDVDTIYKDKYPEAERDRAQLKIIGENAPLAKKRTIRKSRIIRKIKRK